LEIQDQKRGRNQQQQQVNRSQKNHPSAPQLSYAGQEILRRKDPVPKANEKMQLNERK